MFIKAFQIILLYFAASIILMHSVLPHEHHDEISHSDHEEVHAQAESIIDYVLLMFHVDLGDGHMENFETESTHHFSLEYAVDLFPDIVTHHFYPLLLDESTIDKTESVPNHTVPIRNRYVLNSLDFRGPPRKV